MEYLIKVSAILVVFYLCYKLLLNRETFFESNRTFLLLGLTTAFILPLITISKYITVEPAIINNTNVYEGIISQSQTINTGKQISITTILSYLYIGGVVFFLGKFMLQFGSLITLLLKGTKQRVASYIYVITKNAISPFSFFNWIVFNPNQFNTTELEQILTHEKVHAKQLHSIDIIMAELTGIILWFNPLVWLYKKDLKQNLEFIADRNTQANTNCKKNYQHLLLKTSVPNYQVALTNNFYNSSIKKRIVMLHKNRSHKRNQLKFLLVVPALVLFLMSFNTKEVYIQAETDTKEAPSISQKKEPIAFTNSKKTDSKSLTTSPITNNTVKANTIVAQDIAAYFIESTFTDSELDNVITKLKKHGVTLKVKGVKRNSDNEITAIKIEAESNDSNANFSISNDSAIKTIKIVYNAKDGSVSIGNSNNLHFDNNNNVFSHKSGAFTIKKPGKGSNVFVYGDDDDDEHDGEYEIIEDDDTIIIKKGSKVTGFKKANADKKAFVISKGKGTTYEIVQADTLESDGTVVKLNGNVVVTSKNGKAFKTKSTGKSNSTIWINKGDNKSETFAKIGKNGGTFFISGDNSEKSLIIIDGKEVKNKKLEDIDPDTIKSINILKGESAKEKYGEKGKDGVIEITTKKTKD